MVRVTLAILNQIRFQSRGSDNAKQAKQTKNVECLVDFGSKCQCLSSHLPGPARLKFARIARRALHECSCGNAGARHVISLPDVAWLAARSAALWAFCRI